MEEFSDVRFKQRAVMEFLTAEKVPPIEMHRRMQAVYGDQCVDVSTVRRWVRRFKDGELGFKRKHQFFKGWISKTSAALAEVY
jgi:transposase-like protein